jgi:hypothetical protein
MTGVKIMGRRGPQKKLAAIKIHEGNPGRYPVEETGIEGLGEPFVAEHLIDDARGCIEVDQGFDAVQDLFRVGQFSSG